MSKENLSCYFFLSNKKTKETTKTTKKTISRSPQSHCEIMFFLSTCYHLRFFHWFHSCIACISSLHDTLRSAPFFKFRSVRTLWWKVSHFPRHPTDINNYTGIQKVFIQVNNYFPVKNTRYLTSWKGFFIYLFLMLFFSSLWMTYETHPVFPQMKERKKTLQG